MKTADYIKQLVQTGKKEAKKTDLSDFHSDLGKLLLNDNGNRHDLEEHLEERVIAPAEIMEILL